MYHTPVMLDESVSALNLRKGGIYLDLTFGGGGHSREILRRLQGGRLFGFDQDADAEANVPADERFTFVRSNFSHVARWMRYYGVGHVDGILADLGVSSHHFDDAERGFSFRFDSTLDMRMNKRGGVTAAQFLATCSEEELARVLYIYGEIRQSRPMAAAIVRTRAEHPVDTAGKLREAIAPYIRREREKKELARVFQALRIEVNHEMDALSHMLRAATNLLAENGRLVVLTYHSLEDRMVKNFIKAGNAEGRTERDFYGNLKAPLRAVNRKAVTPTAEEQERNPRSRSAKLRVGERT